MSDIIGQYQKKIITDYNILVKRVEAHRVLEKIVGLTIGSYDLLHKGHARYLLKGRSHCDLLVVGVDSDIALKRYKGEHRPIIPQDQRMEMLSYLGFVDYVTLIEDVDQNGEWYFGLLKMLRPDAFIAVEDSYPPEQRKAIRRYCRRLVVLPPQARDTSTTEILRKALSENPKAMATILKKRGVK